MLHPAIRSVFIHHRIAHGLKFGVHGVCNLLNVYVEPVASTHFLIVIVKLERNFHVSRFKEKRSL
jgi:hypothetical protein